MEGLEMGLADPAGAGERLGKHPKNGLAGLRGATWRSQHRQFLPHPPSPPHHPRTGYFCCPLSYLKPEAQGTSPARAAGNYRFVLTNNEETTGDGEPSAPAPHGAAHGAEMPTLGGSKWQRDGSDKATMCHLCAEPPIKMRFLSFFFLAKTREISAITQVLKHTEQKLRDFACGRRSLPLKV